mmetsp:Transcript_73648/g.158013  ORF Transcript_73648/g.158013 Transcript_73648/m.158013 type:complete len:485 (-) Transcript_73648:56-1510(-)
MLLLAATDDRWFQAVMRVEALKSLRRARGHLTFEELDEACQLNAFIRTGGDKQRGPTKPFELEATKRGRLALRAEKEAGLRRKPKDIPFTMCSLGLMAEEAIEEMDERQRLINEREEERRVAEEERKQREEEEARIAAELAEKERRELAEGTKETKKEDKKDKKEGKKDAKIRDKTKLCLLFPGQGSHYPGMMADCLELEGVRKMLEKAAPILGYNIMDIIMGAEQWWTVDQRISQVAMFIADLAAFEKFKVEDPENWARVENVAGFSCGEYAAAVAGGVMGFEDGLRVIKARAESMYKCVEAGAAGGLMSVVGLDEKKAESIAKDLAAKHGFCGISAYTFDQGLTIGGAISALTDFDTAAKKWGAQMVTFLGKEGAFGTAMMMPAVQGLSAALKEAQPAMQAPWCNVWMASTEKTVRAGEDPVGVIDGLTAAMVKPIRWQSTMQRMMDEGIQDFIEVGPQKVLRTMMRRINKDVFKAMLAVEV